MCGTKLDQVSNDLDIGPQTHARFYQYEKMIGVAKKRGFKTYLEVSAKESDKSVVELFATALQTSLGIYKDDGKKCLIM